MGGGIGTPDPPVQVYQVWMSPQMMVLHLSHVCLTLLLFSL